MKDTIKIFMGFIGVGMLLTIIFVRAGEETGVTGGEQASMIIETGTKGLGEIIRSASGR